MQGYLLDTSALSPLLDATHPKHGAAKALIAKLGNAPKYLSVIALSEMMYGLALHEKSKGVKLSNEHALISDARHLPLIDIGPHTAAEYAELKSNLARHYLPAMTKQFRKNHVEDWIDQFTGKAIGIDDNDLWICAQGREHNLILIADDNF